MKIREVTFDAVVLFVNGDVLVHGYGLKITDQRLGVYPIDLPGWNGHITPSTPQFWSYDRNHGVAYYYWAHAGMYQHVLSVVRWYAYGK